MNSSSYKSYISYYWISWIALFPALLLLKFLHVPVLENTLIHVVYFIYWVLLICAHGLEYSRLNSYLEKHHAKKWEELHQISIWGRVLHGYNSFRSIPFIFSSDNLNDENVAWLKSNAKKLIIFTIVVLIGFPIFSIAGAMIP